SGDTPGATPALGLTAAVAAVANVVSRLCVDGAVVVQADK
ncbi:MAG: hypothetical protein RL198_703, partial [Actinomycetota bacterium]